MAKGPHRNGRDDGGLGGLSKHAKPRTISGPEEQEGELGTSSREGHRMTTDVPGNCQCRVLVVDDNQAAAQLLSMFLKLLGHEVCTASDGQAGIEAAAKFLPDVVLMDIGMPRMNGYEAAQYIREQSWGERILLIAVTGQNEDGRQSQEAGFDHHLVKPADASELQRLIQKS